MLPVNNKIFDSTVAADGKWRNISNLGAYSIHFFGMEGNVWVEVSNDPLVLTDGTAISAPAQPTGQSVRATPSNGNQGTWLFKVTYLTPGGETTASPASVSVIVPNSQTLQVNSPVQDAGGIAVGWNVYINNGDGVYRLQNSTARSSVPLRIGESFTLLEYDPAGAPEPTVNTSGSPNAGLNISSNLAANPYVAPTGANETEVISDIANSKQVLYMPSCINFNFLRVRKTGGGSNETIAYLFGQNV